MDIRTFRAASVHEALQMVREELGPDAIVLRTREVRAGGLMGLIRGERCLELTASSDLPALQPLLRPSGKMDRGIDLTGPVSFRVRSSRNEDIHPVNERTDCGAIHGTQWSDFEPIVEEE
jgi:flagellar biosynthesis protein FlhF